MLKEEEFIRIINILTEADDFVRETNAKARKLNDAIQSDFFNASSLSISHEQIVVDLLKVIFNLENDDTLTWWLYEKDYGRKFEMGDFKIYGKDIDLTTAGKLYDYLIEVKNENT